MQTCNKCSRTLSSEHFHKSNKGKLHLYCKDCKTEYNKQWYLANKDKHKNDAKVNNKKYRQEIQDLINKIKANPCTDCKNTFPSYVMDFDHLRDKEFNIAKATRLHLSKSKVLKEIKKCELVCANCHRERTFQRARSSADRAGLS
jgi:hypothetical protein